MAIPKIFVSSTCYDLYDLRNNLRSFIKSFDYEPVMSEFGDIFYDYNLHVQDACVKEIENCQMFILIVGNNYGSNYYKQKGIEKNPSSVTLTEFRKALTTNIPRHIFVNRLVKYDYDNYKRFLDKKYFDHFSNNAISTDEIEQTKTSIKNKFDLEYFFPHESYKHIFKFFDVINELNMNNAIYTFETSTDIQEQLKKQWAGFMYEGLINQCKKDIVSDNREITEMINKIDKIDRIIESLRKDDSGNGKISLDLDNIRIGIDFKELEHYQELFEEYSYELLYNQNSKYPNKERGGFEEEINTDNLKKWLDNLKVTLDKYIWSKYIIFEDVFKEFECFGYEREDNVPYKALFGINNLYTSLGDEEKSSFIEALLIKFKCLENSSSADEVAISESN